MGSLGLVCSKAITVAEFASYVGAQLCGAFLALFTSWLILRRIDYALVAKDSTDGNVIASGSVSAIIIAEGVFTWLLVFTVLNTAVRDAPNQYFGLAIGFVIVVGAYSVG